MAIEPEWMACDVAIAAAVRASEGLWLVTGGAGFIGSNLVEYLLRLGQRVRVLDNFATGKRRNLDEVRGLIGEDNWSRFELMTADIRDTDACRTACRGVTHVLHQAALGSVPRSIDDPITTNNVNVSGFVNMLDAARREGVARFVYAASSSTYGDEPNLPKREDRIGRPLSPYAATKAFNEVYADVFQRTYGLRTIGLRYFNVFGPRQDPEGAYAAVIPLWIKAMIGGLSVRVNGDGETSRDFCYVANAVQANLRAALASDAAWGEVYNVAYGQQTSLNALHRSIRTTLADQGVECSSDVTYGPERAGDVRHSLADVAKAARKLGYVPTHDLAGGLRAAMPWYLNLFPDPSSMKSVKERIAVIGLGYVGLPVAVALAEKFERVVGFDVSQVRVDALRDHRDRTGEVEDGELAASALQVTADPADMAGCTFFIVTVPTPIDEAREPDLGAIVDACRTLGPLLSAGAAVVFESTVYPGVTDDVCAPLLERFSGLTRGRDFFLGYSPERINPGDKEHRLHSVTKVIAAEDRATLARLREVYGSVVAAGLHEAPSIKVAEAAKVIENTQRDLNIALMNELALILDRLGIPTRDVLEAAGTKWNFLRFSPGLVGGHCIGVDPYYLTYASEMAGYHPQVILSGRKVNSEMGAFIGRKALSMVETANAQPRIGVLGLTFKENVPDLRNSKVPDIVGELEAHGATVLVHDPWADAEEAWLEYNIRLAEADELKDLDALIFAVPHAEFLPWVAELPGRIKASGAVVDVRSMVEPSSLPDNIRYWSL